MVLPQIQVNNLSFYYNGSDNPVLTDINLEFNEGEIVCVTGTSGGGKTTLALALSGHIPHTIAGELRGEVNFQGISSLEMSISDISQFIGLVQQDPENQLVTSSVLEEIAFGPENLALPKEDILNRVQTSIKAMDLISLVNRSTNELSGGEKQRVVIASILAMQPKVLILDEPTSFLDNRSIQNLILSLKELNKCTKLTIILIEHQPYVFKKLLDKLIVIEQGKVIKEMRESNINFRSLKVPHELLKEVKQIPHQTSSNRVLKTQELTIMLNKREALKQISLELTPGRIYGIVGPNGAGKTTLLQALLNLVPSTGNIIYNKKDITKSPTFQLAKKIGLVFQNPNHQIFERNILEEVIFAPKNFKLDLHDINLKANQLLKEAALDSYLNQPPFGLSYGEKRRLNICSILIYTPDLLLLDEPFIGQDRANIEYLIQKLKERKQKGFTTIIVSHRRELYDLVDYIFVLDKGKLVNQGTPDEVIPFLYKTRIINFLREMMFNE
ncbi:MAG: ABC transporter ATP-binding protein [Promethearchaeota archaeon]